MQARVHKPTGRVLSLGIYKLNDLDADIEIIQLTEGQEQKLKERGSSHSIDSSGKITVHPVLDIPPTEQPEYGTDADIDNAAVIQAVTSLRQYINAASPNAQQTAAVVKLMARILLFIIRRSVRLM